MEISKKQLELGSAAWIIAALLARASIAAVILTDSPDIKIRDATTPTIEAPGGEPTVAVHPEDWRILLMGLIAPSTSSTGWFSTDGGVHWHGNNDPADPNFSGDPAVAILKGTPTRYLLQSITKSTEQWVTWSDNPSIPWTGDARICNEFETTDKGFLQADNHPSSTFFGRLYSLWSPLNAGLHFRYSPALDRGEHWEPQPNPIPLRPSGSTWGGVISVGIAPSPKLGDVYVAWPSALSLQDAPTAIQFRRSDFGGQAFEPAIEVTNYTGKSFKPRQSVGLNTGGANSIPTMAADDLGNIYVAWCQRRRAGDEPAGTDAQLYVSKSSNDGANWSTTPVPITSSTANEWLPWIAWDNETKALTAVYYDDRADPTRAEVYLAVSYDRATTFTEFKISDASWSGDSMAGDYMGIACGGGIAYPLWCDDRESGVVKAFTSPILIGAIDAATITPIVGQSCASPGDPRVRFEVDWTTLVSMDGLDRLTVTSPNGTVYEATANSPSTNHVLVLYDLPCGSGTNHTWKYRIESNKGGAVSRSEEREKDITCISCPPPCNPPCELE